MCQLFPKAPTPLFRERLAKPILNPSGIPNNSAVSSSFPSAGFSLS
jgi:hypothetical protein